MFAPWRRWIKRFRKGERGSIAVEFAILFPIFLTLVLGIVDFGHAWYMKQIITDASREGARYGARYVTQGEKPIVPSAKVPTIVNYVLNDSPANSGKGGFGLTKLLPSDASPVVTPSGAGYALTSYTAGTSPGLPIDVTVTAVKTWWILSKFVPNMSDSITLSSTTSMAVE